MREALVNTNAVLEFAITWLRDKKGIDALREDNSGEVLLDLLLDANERCSNAAFEALERLEMADFRMRRKAPPPDDAD